MSEGNTALEALHASDENAALKEQLAALQKRLEEAGLADEPTPLKSAGEAPRYRLNGRVFLEDDTLHEEGEELNYLGIPNMEMVPLNESAKKRMREWLDSLAAEAKRVAEMNGRVFSGLITDRGHLIAQAMQDARNAADKVQVVNAPTIRGEVPVMPHLETQQVKRQRGRPSKASLVSGVTPPPKPGKPSPQPVATLGRDYTSTAATYRG